MTGQTSRSNLLPCRVILSVKRTTGYGRQYHNTPGISRGPAGWWFVVASGVPDHTTRVSNGCPCMNAAILSRCNWPMAARVVCVPEP